MKRGLNSMLFQDRFKKIRKDLGLKQQEMAVQLKISLSGYSGENGQWPCRESGRLYAVKTATIPVKTARV